MIEIISIYFERVAEYWPNLLKSLNETGIMMGFAMVAAIVLGLPLGTLLYLTDEDKPLHNKFIYHTANVVVNIVRSFPFLLLVIAMQPLIREVYGRSIIPADGDCHCTVCALCAAVAARCAKRCC